MKVDVSDLEIGQDTIMSPSKCYTLLHTEET